LLVSSPALPLLIFAELQVLKKKEKQKKLKKKLKKKMMKKKKIKKLKKKKTERKFSSRKERNSYYGCESLTLTASPTSILIARKSHFDSADVDRAFYDDDCGDDAPYDLCEASGSHSCFDFSWIVCCDVGYVTCFGCGSLMWNGLFSYPFLLEEIDCDRVFCGSFYPDFGCDSW